MNRALVVRKSPGHLARTKGPTVPARGELLGRDESKEGTAARAVFAGTCQCNSVEPSCPLVYFLLLAPLAAEYHQPMRRLEAPA